MSLDPELLKQLISTFSTELDEQTQLMIDCLLRLEKNSESEEDIQSIFRAAHNLKGAARGIGIQPVSEISHGLESLFTKIQKKMLPISSEIINLSLDAIDKIKLSMKAYLDHSDLPFDINAFLKSLEEGFQVKKPEEKPVAVSKEKVDSSETIRISINKLDQIAALMEEMQVNKIAIDESDREVSQLFSKTKEYVNFWNQLKQTISRQLGNEKSQLLSVGNDYLTEIMHVTTNLQKNIHQQINDLSLLSNSLQEEIRMLRLIPAGTLLLTLTRYVRDLSQELNKKVDLVIQGEDVKMDKAILEELKNPLIHLLRNAIDHGIEPADIRKKLNKPESATIKISVEEKGGQISITISDDGAGIDSKKIADIALSKNLLTQSEIDKLDENQILELIFLPGFSTKDNVTDISGRGVGLDVVKSALINLKGSIDLHTVLHQGTQFSFTLPLTLASERGLLIKCSDQLFVIPTASVMRILTLHHEEILLVENNQAIRVDNNTIPLKFFSKVMNLPQKEILSDEKISIVIIKIGWQSVGLVVDEVIGEREIVIKPLQPPLNKIPCVAGGTLLESNQVVIVLNIHDLLNFSLHAESSSEIKIESMDKKSEKIHILVVDDSITTRTLEKSILENKNYQVTVAVNGKEAWDILQNRKFNLLITDVSMPIMDGFTLTEHVKKSEKLRDMPVIIVTSLGSENEKKRGVEVGANAYIVKNEFESGLLLEIVSQLV